MEVPLIPYFQTTRYRVQTMIDLANIQSGEYAADLGSGDGRIVIALASGGAMVYGYELNEELISQSKEDIKKQKLEQTAFILNIDFWTEDLSKYAIITIYGMPDVMEELEKKLQKELNPGTRVLSNYYPFPNWKETAKKDNVYLYIK